MSIFFNKLIIILLGELLVMSICVQSVIHDYTTGIFITWKVLLNTHKMDFAMVISILVTQGPQTGITLYIVT